MTQPVRVGIIGSQFISSIHAESLQRYPHCQIVAAASPTKAHITTFAKRFGIPNVFTDHRKMLELDDLDLVVVGVPNDLHCRIALDAAAAGKHIVMEKPLCLNLAEADRTIFSLSSRMSYCRTTTSLSFPKSGARTALRVETRTSDPFFTSVPTSIASIS